jgi:hypothetical protein
MKTRGMYLNKWTPYFSPEPRDRLQSCARLCVEVDLEKGVTEEIHLTLDRW